MHERYSIEVRDGIVEIYGDLTIEETYDFLSFFERKGYKSVVLGSENSTLRMMKIDFDELNDSKYVKELKEQISIANSLLNEKEKLIEESREKLIYTENLYKDLMSEEYEKYKKIRDENLQIIKSNIFFRLKDSEAFKKMTESFDNGFDEESESNEEREKQEYYEKLIQLRKDFPQIPIPSPWDFYINPDQTKE